MWRSLVLVALLAGLAHADRKEAGPDTPPLADVVRIELELGAPPDKPACQPLTWTIHVDLSRDRWERSDRTCTVVNGAERVTTQARKGTLRPAVKAALAKRYADLNARVPKFCDGGTEQILEARLVRRDGSHVQLVDRGCEKPAYLRDLAAVVLAP